jgi:hypothetical protein
MKALGPRRDGTNEQLRSSHFVEEVLFADLEVSTAVFIEDSYLLEHNF